MTVRQCCACAADIDDDWDDHRIGVLYFCVDCCPACNPPPEPDEDDPHT